jgi:hypothetical protein
VKLHQKEERPPDLRPAASRQFPPTIQPRFVESAGGGLLVEFVVTVLSWDVLFPPTIQPSFIDGPEGSMGDPLSPQAARRTPNATAGMRRDHRLMGPPYSVLVSS